VTPLSGQKPRPGLARSSLCLLALAVATPACLVTSTPSFEPPERTAPFLVPATAVPDPRLVRIVDSTDLAQKQSVDFSAYVISEDRDDVVSFQLYIDYGFPENPGGQPFRASFSNIAELPPSTITDTSRSVKARWFPNSMDPGLGCHNVTLIASHEFDSLTGCPRCQSDSSQITWQVYRCDSVNGFPCNSDFSACAMWSRSCPVAVNAEAALKCGVTP